MDRFDFQQVLHLEVNVSSPFTQVMKRASYGIRPGFEIDGRHH